MILRPGDIRLAHVPDPWGRPDYAHKRRPVVLVERGDNHGWQVASLTRLSQFKNGAPRTALPGWEASGLDAQPFLWADRLNHVPSGHVDSALMGRAAPEMVNALVALLDLPTRLVVDMLHAEGAV